MIPVGKEPSIQYPIGTTIEDSNAIMKILQFKKCRTGHAYKVDVLKWKVEPSDEVKKHLDMNNFWILVIDRSIPNIKVIE